ncbi:hypothetical protein [Glycomyces rhizosphaerae]|uniref:Uncharacterized protein n=1 Tax=Glycomyces rhizosphaerae TaxID=2054422 RepID=A0ABV7Q0I0_9ACTN
MATDAPEGDLDALLALYTTDRDKLSTLAGERLALLAIQVTYLGLAIIALGGQRPIGGEWVAAFSAAPLWFMHAHHQVLIAAALSRSRSVALLEERVVARAGLEGVHAQVAHRAAVAVRELAGQSGIFRLQTFITFGGIAAALIAFTGYALVVAAANSAWTSLPVMLAILFYSGFAVVASIGWTQTVRTQLRAAKAV